MISTHLKNQAILKEVCVPFQSSTRIIVILFVVVVVFGLVFGFTRLEEVHPSNLEEYHTSEMFRSLKQVHSSRQNLPYN